MIRLNEKNELQCNKGVGFRKWVKQDESDNFQGIMYNSDLKIEAKESWCDCFKRSMKSEKPQNRYID